VSALILHNLILSILYYLIFRSPQKPFTRKDARKMVNRKLLPHGFDMKSKGISHTSLKRVNSELAEHRNKLKLVSWLANFISPRKYLKLKKPL